MSEMEEPPMSALLPSDPDLHDAGLRVRPADAGDGAFLFAMFAIGRADLLGPLPLDTPAGQTLIRQQYQIHRMGLSRRHAVSADGVIERNGVPVGHLLIAREDGADRIVDIVIAPDHRGRGIAGRLIAALCRRAEAEGKPVRLSVLRGNRAAALYRRLGFVPRGGGDGAGDDDGPFVEMEWRHSGGGGPPPGIAD